MPFLCLSFEVRPLLLHHSERLPESLAIRQLRKWELDVFVINLWRSLPKSNTCDSHTFESRAIIDAPAWRG